MLRYLLSANLKSIKRVLFSNNYSTAVSRIFNLSTNMISNKQTHSNNTCSRRFLNIYLTGGLDDPVLEDIERRRLNQFCRRTKKMASERFPGYRKDRLKRKLKRRMKANRKVGKIANRKVKALVDFINLEKFYKYQL